MIPYPDHKTEFEIQSDVYQFLLSEGFNVRGEISERKNIRLLSGNKRGQRTCRFDIVVFDKNNKPICIIEIKRSVKKKLPSEYKQYAKYSLYNIPVIFFWRDSLLDDLYQDLLNM